MSEAYARLEPTLIRMLQPLCLTCQGCMMLKRLSRAGVLQFPVLMWRHKASFRLAASYLRGHEAR